MNTFVVAIFCLAVATASAGHLGLGLVGHAAHIPSGSIGVGPNGAVIAGPSGSVRTDNGLHGHGAGVNVAGPAGDIRTQGGHAVLSGPGLGGHAGLGLGGHAGLGVGHGLAVASPAVAVAAPLTVTGWGHGAGLIGAGVGAWGHGAGLVGAGWNGALLGGHGLSLIGHGHHGW